MIKIIFKSIVLVFIILSVYFIVHPAACSNWIAGRVTNPTDMEPGIRLRGVGDHGNMLAPAQDRPLRQEAAPVVPAAPAQEKPADSFEPAVYTQEDVDRAIAMRYVDLEREYAKSSAMGKDSAKEIAYVVMADFELTPEEWEAFLQRATAVDLFNQVRDGK